MSSDGQSAYERMKIYERENREIAERLERDGFGDIAKAYCYAADAYARCAKEIAAFDEEA